MFNLAFVHPFSMIISGPSSSGKSTYLYKLLQEADRLIKPQVPPYRVIFYAEYQDLYDSLIAEGLITEAIQGVPPMEKLREMTEPYKNKGGSLFIVDDGFNEIGNTMETMFVQGSHHLNASIIHVCQSLFHENRKYRTMSLNCKYLVVMKSPRDQQQIIHLASQIAPYRTGFIMDAWNRATKLPYSYLIFDFSQFQSDAVRLRSRLFEDEFPPVVFLENS